MPYTIKLTKKQREQIRKEISENIDTLEGSELEKAKAFFDKMKKYKDDGHISHDEFLTILKAKFLKDEHCRKVINEVMNLNIAEYDIEKAVQDFLQTNQLPKDPKLRMKALEEKQSQLLDKRRELETQRTGSDPDIRFVGKSEDGTEDIYERYVKCSCGKVFKTFKNELFCSSSCREQWVSKKLPTKPLVQEIWSENNNESWNWERVGNRTDKDLGTYGIFRRVFKDEK